MSAPSIDDIFLTEGASQGVHLILETLITSPNDSIMIPIPQYPLYSASISLNGGHMCPYYLNEEKGWQLDLDELERSIQQAKKEGKNPKALVIINPGNPTGAIFNAETIQKIIEFSVKNKLVLISDEVICQLIQGLQRKHLQARRRLRVSQQSPQLNARRIQERLRACFSSFSLKGTFGRMWSQRRVHVRAQLQPRNHQPTRQAQKYQPLLQLNWSTHGRPHVQPSTPRCPGID